jgi:Domain of unknown function (DUF4440)
MQDQAADLAALTTLNARFIHNFITNDVAAHDAILHPRFLYVNSAGKRIERAPYLLAWANGFDPDVIPYWDTRDERIDIFGDAALVRATNRYVEIKDGRETIGRAAYTDAYVREGGVWLCIQAQITAVTPANWPDDATIVSVYRNGQKVM